MSKESSPLIVKEVLALIGDKTTKEVSEKSGIKETTVWRIMTGRTKMNVDQLEKIMEGFEITWVRVLWRITDPKRSQP